MKKVMFMHYGSGNHGCEALVRTTARLLGGPENVRLWSLNKEEDIQYGSAECVEAIVESEELKRFSSAYFEAMVRRKILKQENASMDVFLREQFRGNIAVSIGGDNYCYPWSAKQAVELNRKIRKHCIASVLWGCSIDEEAITPEVREDLSRYDLITAREPITYALLKRINPNTIQVADPAFLLERKDLLLPKEFKEGNTVGINISPLIMDYGSDCMILRNYENLIRFILEKTDMNICLIAHVIWEKNNDRTPIHYLYDKFKGSGRVCEIEDANACELKGYIARCRFFVGARTHATIAAYSSCVPTLVVGYSVKSRGIAQDLFGTDEGYVLPVQNMSNEHQLRNALIGIIEREIQIREMLEYVIPEYVERAKTARGYVDRLLV